MSRYALFVSYIVAWSPAAVVADESKFGLSINKLDHLFLKDISLFEVEVTFGDEDGGIGLKSESEYFSGTYGGSENQLYFARPLGERASGFFGVRYLDWKEDGVTSALFGVQAVAAFDIDVVVSTFLDGEGQVEGRLEFERPTMLGSRLEIQPKIELRAFNRDVDSVSAELRLAYATTDRLQTYVGFAWSRVIGSSGDENERTALAGLSFEW